MEWIKVERKSDDGLTRKLWCFQFQGKKCRLTSYHEQTRSTSRHGWKGPKWDHSDERRYNSQMPRPQTVPLDVIQEALDKHCEAIRKDCRFFVGFFSHDCALVNYP